MPIELGLANVLSSKASSCFPRVLRLLDDELLADVLAADMTVPVYSARRAALIRFAPALTGGAKLCSDVPLALPVRLHS
jgi:hypothetical protein